jgi:TolB-like protein/Flp pilus assembly protein TadD
MSTEASSNFFITGGTLPTGSRSYVERRADADLLDHLVRSEFCYILTSRQMGKSSLMVRTRDRLVTQGASIVVLDLTAIGQNLTPEQWYDGLAMRLARQLRLEGEIEDYWFKNERLGPCQRFFNVLSEVALPALKARASQKWESGWDDNSSSAQSNRLPKASGRLVLFIDELDVVRSLPFRTDEFFAAIRECYTRRLEDPEFNRLSFCLLGVATPSQLIQDVNTTPFNVGRRIELRDFSLREASGLKSGLETALRETDPALRSQEADQLLDRILFWTNGHPYLTQRLCRALIAPPGSISAAGIPNPLKHPQPSRIASQSVNPAARRIDLLCEDLFLVERAREKDDNLLYVRDRMLRSDVDKTELLYLYNRIRLGEEVKDDETDTVVNTLLLSGIVRIDGSRLVVRNRIYHEVFDDDWIRANRPERPGEAKGVAVLPFVNRSPNKDDEFLSDGLSEDLILALSRVPGLRVPARTSSFAFKGRNDDVRHIAARLGVSYVVEGSVRHIGDQLRITVQLISAADGTPVWSEQYDRAWKDVFAVQDEITKAIVAGLKVELTAETDFAKRSQTGADAYQSYLRGRFHLHHGSADGFADAVRHFEACLRLAPDHAPSYAAIAECRLHQFLWGLVPKREALAEGRGAALKALELDEGLPEVHVSLALMHGIIDWNREGEERHLSRALELNPNNATAYAYLAILRAVCRQFDESIAAARRGVELDPLSPFVNHHLAASLYFANRLIEAEAATRRTLELEPNFFRSHGMLSNILQDLGRYDDAIAAARKAMELQPNPVSLATLGCALARAGRPAEARAIMARLEGLRQTREVNSTAFARVYVALGNIPQALDAIEHAYQQHEGDMELLGLWTFFKPLYVEPRFQRILNLLNLPMPPASLAPLLPAREELGTDSKTIPAATPSEPRPATAPSMTAAPPAGAPAMRVPVSTPISTTPSSPTVAQTSEPTAAPPSPTLSSRSRFRPIQWWLIFLVLGCAIAFAAYVLHELNAVKDSIQR